MDQPRMPQVGEKVADFELPDSTGTPQRLASLVGNGSLVLIFYRGYW